MHFGSRLFVIVVFSMIGLAFWVNTLQLYLEFAHGTNLWQLDKPISLLSSFDGWERQTWFLLITHYSDLFVFFPVFGTIALLAFFRPAATLVDMYWNTARQGSHRIPLSKLRFSIGLVAVALASAAVGAATLEGGERTLWQLKPEVLAADQGVGCVAAKSCDRVGFLDALVNIRRTSRERVTLSDLVPKCRQDWFVQPTADERAPRYCPVTTNVGRDAASLDGLWVSAKTCCDAQRLFDAAVKAQFAEPGNRSTTNEIQQWLWPFNIFFLLTLFALSVLLAVRRKHIEEVYPESSRAIDRGVIIGALAMVMLPLMHNGFLLTTQLMHGDDGAVSLHRIPETFTVAFGLWGVLIIVSFLHPAHKQAEPFSRLLGVVGSLVFAVKGDVITDYVVRLAGAGAGFASIIAMFALAIVLLAVLWGWKWVSRAKPGGEPASETTGGESRA